MDRENKIALRIARSLRAGYYKPGPGPIDLDEVERRWAEQWDKIYDNSMPIMVPVRDLWKHREYTWTREKSRSGNAKVDGKTVYLSGPLKWDAIKADMELRGWDKDEPIHFMVGRNGGMKVGEGNHRLAIAREIGMSKVPVWFHFDQRVSKSPEPEPVVNVPAKSVKKMVEDVPPKDLSPQEQEQINEIMDLLGMGRMGATKTELTKPANQLDFRLTYSTGAKKWTDDRPGDGKNPERKNYLEEIFGRGDVKRALKVLEKAIGEYLETGSDKPIGDAVSKMVVDAGEDPTKDVIRHIHKIEKEQLDAGNGPDNQDKIVEGLGIAKNKMNERISMDKNIVASELKAIAELVEPEWLTREQVAEVCPSCADKMAAKGMCRIKASVIEDAKREAANKWKTMPKGWTKKSRKKFWESLTGDNPEHRVTECIKKMKGKIDDPGAFCAALADRVRGTTKWRGKKKD